MMQLVSPHDMVKNGLCIGCGSCVSQSNFQAAMRFDNYGELKPHGPGTWYHQKSEALTNTCPFSPQASTETEIGKLLFPHNKESGYIGYYRAAYAGYAAEEDFRQQGSSGGMVTWVATELLRQGLIDGVAHVVASDDPEKDGHYFHYRISRNEDAVRQGAKSRYYPVEMSGILKTILEEPGRYAVVGIPCFIKAINLLRRANPVLNERIKFTLGLFCGHMKSARFVESFAWQMHVPVQEVQKVEFRQKIENRPANWYNAKLTLKDGTEVSRDWWNLADGDWGAGYFMNHACNYCDDVVAETADVSFGDAWVEPYASDGRGTNVVVVRSPVVDDIIQKAVAKERLRLQAVDEDFVVQTQAAGFRQRREGLAYRLTWADSCSKVRKRVMPDDQNIRKDRKKIYRLRYYISKWSHRMFALARKLNTPMLYKQWARAILSIYYGMAYHNGSWQEIKNRFKGLK